MGFSGIFLAFLKTTAEEPLVLLEPRDFDIDDKFFVTWVNYRLRKAFSTRLFLLDSVVLDSRDMATTRCSSGSGSGSGVFPYAMRLNVPFMSIRP